jgi:serine protease Do
MLIVGLLNLPVAAIADVREAAQRAVRATVAVEFETRESPTTPLPPGVPPAVGPVRSIPQPADLPNVTPPIPPSPTSDDGATADAVQKAYRFLVQSGAAADPEQPTAVSWDAAVRAANRHVRARRVPDLTMSSGTVVSPEGLIATLGLPSGEGRLKVTFHNGAQHDATVVVRDLRTGLQLLHVDSTGVPALRPAERSAEIGDSVIAGYCLSERDRAVGRGIVAATDRTLPGFTVGLLQTDARVGRMSAGGPLVNENGELVGILAAVQTQEPDAPGLTLAIPADHIRALLEARREGDVVEIQHPWLGIQPVEQPEDGAVSIAQVFENSPAEAAGLQKDDELIAVAGERIHSPRDVVRVVGSRRVGDRLEITIRRGDDEQVLTVTLGHVPSGTPTARTPRHPALRITVPVAGRILLYDADGTLRSLPVPPGQDHGDVLATRTLRVERSDVEQKLDELSRDVRDLKAQIEDLSRQLQRQTDKPAGDN